MQKLIRRTALAQRQADRRLKKRHEIFASDKRKAREQESIPFQQSIVKNIRDERRARREDWIRGPLAPRRDVGEAAKTFGAVHPRRTQGIDKPDARNYHIVEGDRVVIAIRGHREEGKIGVVRSVQKDREECVVEDLNKANVTIPEHLLVKETDKTPYRPFEIPLPLSGVKLVAKLPHPETGIARDVVINKLACRKYPKYTYRQDPNTGETIRGERTEEERLERFIAGLTPRTIVPFPEKAQEEFDDNPVDTLRLDVEDITWTPTLHEEPMPSMIINELRNKYSKFRTRHDDAYVAKVEEEDRKAREAKGLLKLKMVTPLQELRMKEKFVKEATGAPQLSEEDLARIGAIMAQNGQAVPEAPQDVSSA